MKRDHDNLCRINDLLENGVKEGVYPGAVLLVAQKSEIVFLQEIGQLALIARSAPMRMNTIFDLASLTKPLATTLALMKLVDDGKIGLDQPLSEIVKKSHLMDKKELTSRQMLSHSAGFADWKPFYLELVKYRLEERKRVLRDWIVKEPLASPPGKGAFYSDLGFMILEWIIEEASGMPMRGFVERNFYRLLSLERTFLSTFSLPVPFHKGEFAPTENCPWRKKVIQGEVHDDNAYALGGYSGHAGLFGTVEEVYKIVNLLREHQKGWRDDFFRPKTVREFFTRQDRVVGCTWGLGWDTPSPQDSSSGKYFSRNSVGHLGFTGSSIWMDLDRDVIVVFLTNRIHPTRNNEKIKGFRPRLHDLVMEELGFRIDD